MKTGDNIGFAVTGYLAIGVVIGLTQLGLSKLFEPPCSGIARHTLWERDYSKDTHFLWRAGSSVVQWLPDLYSRVFKGDMTAWDYLLGGYRCEPVVALKPPVPSLSNNPLLGLSRTTIPGGLGRPSEIPSLSSKPPETSGSSRLDLGGNRLPGSQAEALVKQTPDKTAATATLTPPTSTQILKSLQFESLLQRQNEAPSTLLRNSMLSDEVVKQALKPWRDSGATSTKQSAPESQFVTIEALPGVSLAVPRDWLVVSSEETQQLVTASEAVYGIGQGISKTENVRVFQPPTAVEGVSIAVISMPVSLPQQEWRTANDAQLHEWASVFTQQARRGIEAQGFKLLPLADFSRELIGDWLGISFKMRIVDTEGTVFEQAQICVPTTSRTIVLNLSYGKDAPPIFRPILAHARETLRIVEARKP